MTTDPLLTARGITKRYHQNAVPAVDNANLRLHGGSIHGIVGENGAGKSTLMHVIAGAVTPESGTVEMRGRRLDLTGSSSALEAGIVISFQHPRMVDSLSVWENLVLGDEPGNRFGIIDRSAAIQRISDSGLAVPGLDLNSRVKNLSSGRVRLVSLMAAIMRLPTAYEGVLILDEPTAACGPDETLAIMEVMRGAARSGHGVLFITHKLSELESIADTVTIMKNGRDVSTLTRPFAPDQVAELVFGDVPVTPGEATLAPGSSRDASVRHDPDGSPRHFGEVVFTIRDIGLTRNQNTLLSGISLSIRAGEIMGLTGTRQSGIEAIEGILAGTVRSDSGTITFKGTNITGLSSHGLRSHHIGYVPTDRMIRGASLGSSVADNLIVLERRQLQRAGVFLPARVARYGRRLTEEFDIDGVLNLPLSQLSGGNIQKVILGRELAEAPELLIVCEPSWGLDARSRDLIVQRIRDLAEGGAAVLIISTDLDEVLEISDTVAGLYSGKLVKLAPAAQMDRNELGRLIFGSSAEADINGD